MNEKIRQLADKAGIGFYWDSPSVYAPANEPPVEQALIIPEELEKFAQLIVRECANVAADHEALDIYEEIREHFGVEE